MGSCGSKPQRCFQELSIKVWGGPGAGLPTTDDVVQARGRPKSRAKPPTGYIFRAYSASMAIWSQLELCTPADDGCSETRCDDESGFRHGRGGVHRSRLIRTLRCGIKQKRHIHPRLDTFCGSRHQAEKRRAREWAITALRVSSGINGGCDRKTTGNSCLSAHAGGQSGCQYPSCRT